MLSLRLTCFTTTDYVGKKVEPLAGRHTCKLERLHVVRVMAEV
jgi:hypothetical protein